MIKFVALLLVGITGYVQSDAQPLNKKKVFTHQDTLRGSNGEGRQRWNVLHYDISITPDFNTKSLTGITIIRFYDEGAKRMQLDMQEPMIIDSVLNDGKKLPISREGNVYWAILRDPAAMYKLKPDTNAITIYFHGTPTEAKRPPWDGGWIWKKDKNGNPWMTAACQGLGASVWYPCKDYQGDEPDMGATLRIRVPDTLTAVGNGRMTAKRKLPNAMLEYEWKVTSPINNYNIIPYIGKYVNFSEVYAGEKGNLDMSYWVLDYNLAKAKKQFTDATRTMQSLEHWFGPYPFYEDGYKLVEAPHLGMEHQSAVAYGNGFQNGYRGSDLSGSGWGLKFDFIIVHESGHEWFANNITTNDIADMWVHEGFTNYSETLFTEYFYGKEAGNDYVIGTRKNIANDIPIIGTYGVNKEGSGDMYYKAGNMLHSIRQVINNDEKFRMILRGLNKTFYHQVVTSAQVEAFINGQAKRNFSKIFDQYLRTTKIPVLEYRIAGKKLWYHYTNCVDGFDLPLKVYADSSKTSFKWIKPTSTKWKQVKYKKEIDPAQFAIDRNFLVEKKQVQ